MDLKFRLHIYRYNTIRNICTIYLEFFMIPLVGVYRIHSRFRGLIVGFRGLIVVEAYSRWHRAACILIGSDDG